MKKTVRTAIAAVAVLAAVATITAHHRRQSAHHNPEHQHGPDCAHPPPGVAAHHPVAAATQSPHPSHLHGPDCDHASPGAPANTTPPSENAPRGHVHGPECAAHHRLDLLQEEGQGRFLGAEDIGPWTVRAFRMETDGPGTRIVLSLTGDQRPAALFGRVRVGKTPVGDRVRAALTPAGEYALQFPATTTPFPDNATLRVELADPVGTVQASEFDLR